MKKNTNNLSVVEETSCFAQFNPIGFCSAIEAFDSESGPFFLSKNPVSSSLTTSDSFLFLMQCLMASPIAAMTISPPTTIKRIAHQASPEELAVEEQMLSAQIAVAQEESPEHTCPLQPFDPVYEQLKQEPEKQVEDAH